MPDFSAPKKTAGKPRLSYFNITYFFNQSAYTILRPRTRNQCQRMKTECNFETSTRLKSRDSRTCKQALEEDSGFTVAGEPLQVYLRETDGQSFRHGLVHGFA